MTLIGNWKQISQKVPEWLIFFWQGAGVGPLSIPKEARQNLWLKEMAENSGLWEETICNSQWLAKSKSHAKEKVNFPILKEKIWPISVKRRKPVWIPACFQLLKHLL